MRKEGSFAKLTKTGSFCQSDPGMETSAFAKDPSFLMRRSLAALFLYTLRLYGITLLQKLAAIIKSGRSMLRPYGINRMAVT